MLESILNTTSSNIISIQSLVFCTITSLVLGICTSYIYMYNNIYNKSFVTTLAILPVMVQAVIMLVNGNLGTGVAVLGAFGLIRFRSIPGGAKEIGSIFFAMAIGLATGMGYILFAILFAVLVGGMTIILSVTSFGEQNASEKELKITIPENLDYSGIFDDLFLTYTKKAELTTVKTSNMGSLYELQYNIILKNQDVEKEFIDQIRCRNGNLNIICGRTTLNKSEL